ncbi:YIP1 family protein [Methanogenium cariaci]|jgi:hypothetical protein
MTSGITGRITGVLFHPTETFADTIRSDTLKDTLIYLLILVVIFTVFSAALLLVGVSVYAGLATGIAAGGLSVIALIPMLFFGGLVGAIIFAAYMHIWVYIAGGREGITETWKAVIYASTPSLLLGWIPVVGFVMWAWSLVLIIIGIRELQEMTTTRAVLAVFIGYLILAALGVTLVGSMLAGILSVS